MPENEFEKKVSSEMHELKFKPSEQVWEKVEERIRKKKDRRIFVIIFLFTGLALLGYWQWDNLFGEKDKGIVKTEMTDNSTQSNQKEIEAEKTNQPQINNESLKEKDEQKKSDDVKQQEIVDKSIDKKNTGVEKYLATKNKQERIFVSGNKTNQNRTEKQQKKSNQNSITKAQKESVIVASSNNNKPVVNTNNENEIKQEQIKQDQAAKERTEVKPIEKTDTTKSEVAEPKTVTETKKDTVSIKAPVKDSAAAVVQKNPSQKKWKWGLVFTPGVSSLNDQSFSIGGKAMASDLNFQSPVNSGGAPPPPPPTEPSGHKAGFAFNLGGFMQGQISKKSQLVFGLQYAYYSEKIKVGNTAGGANASFYLSSAYRSSSSYSASNPYQEITNSYHFIEAEASYQLRLNKNQTKPFTWNLGFNLGQLIATNAVMYDTVSRGIYHKNTDYLNKTQFSLSTGFSWTLMNNNRGQLILGPAVDVHLNSFLDNPFETKKHLFFAGLRSAYIFNSKK